MALDGQGHVPVRRRRGLQLQGESDRKQAERARAQIEAARANGIEVDEATGFTVLHLPAAEPDRSRRESPVRRRQPL